MSLSDWADVGTIITAVAVIFAVLQVISARTQRHREFENMYVQRYWRILDAMPDRMYLNHETFDPTHEEARLALAYLRLSEDEIDLRKQGYITNRTWLIWSNGMLAQLEAPIYAEALVEHANLLPSLSKFVQRRGEDPLAWGTFYRWWSGLY